MTTFEMLRMARTQFLMDAQTDTAQRWLFHLYALHDLELAGEDILEFFLKAEIRNGEDIYSIGDRFFTWYFLNYIQSEKLRHRAK